MTVHLLLRHSGLLGVSGHLLCDGHFLSNHLLLHGRNRVVVSVDGTTVCVRNLLIFHNRHVLNSVYSLSSCDHIMGLHAANGLGELGLGNWLDSVVGGSGSHSHNGGCVWGMSHCVGRGGSSKRH